MEYIHAIALGIIQGVAELFPVSSAAHTLLISALLGWSLPSLPFVVMLHFGTFLAVLLYFARDYVRIIKGFFTGFLHRWRESDERLGLLVVLGSIPLAIVGKIAEPYFDRLFAMPVFAACFLLVTGLVLFLIERMRARSQWTQNGYSSPASQPETESVPVVRTRMWFPGREGKPRFEGAAALSIPKALWVGLSQVGGLVPGGSRSGFSIAAGMGSGLSREEAARFSFLLAGPAIVGATAFELLRILHPKPDEASQNGIASLTTPVEPHLVIFTGFVVAFVAGLIAIRFFMRYVNDHKLTPFAYYCWAFGLATLAILLARGHA